MVDQNILGNYQKEGGDYYVKLSKKKDTSTLGDLPESRPFGVDIDLAHKIYNWGHWKKIQAHKVMNHFLLTCGGDILDLAPERPIDADNFAVRYNMAKNPIKPMVKKTARTKKRTIKKRTKR